MSPFYADVAAALIDVTVVSTTTLVTGGALDWIGRASIKRRSDDVLVMVYRRGSHHAINDGALYIKFSDDNGATWTAENTKLGGGAVSGFPMNPSTLTAGQDAGEGWLMVAPNGDLLLHMWRIDYTVSWGGTYQSRSTDGGETWSSAPGPIQFTGLTVAQNSRAFATDDDFVLDGTIYAGARVYVQNPDEATYGSAVVLIASDDNGATWTRESTLISSADLGGVGTEEVGLEYIGNDEIIAMIRDTATITHGYQMIGTNLGAADSDWPAAPGTDVTTTAGILSRPRVYTRAHLKGEANWWSDPVLLMTGFVHQTPGSSHPRRSAVWVSQDRGDTWSRPQYIDASTEDAGYGDMFYDADNDEWVVVTYYGTQAAADLKQYRLTISGI